MVAPPPPPPPVAVVPPAAQAPPTPTPEADPGPPPPPTPSAVPNEGICNGVGKGIAPCKLLTKPPSDPFDDVADVPGWNLGTPGRCDDPGLDVRRDLVENADVPERECVDGTGLGWPEPPEPPKSETEELSSKT
ncbi:hypothetical protein FRB94_012314 [Tulasnella sp. JGI-2019a]|nr:hypothetical protein FRB94_012314 [Tulasnella sp. JGI-2019a]KAG9005869.1 hypothetical protein FRB93_009267 [Tulasnella sp. JGI-2019a]